MRPWPIVATLTLFLLLVILGKNRIFNASAVEHHGHQVDLYCPRSECLACHEGVTAKEVPRCMPVCYFGESHPTSKEYPPRGREKDFKPAAQAGVRFIGGRLECITCHSLSNQGRYHLRSKDRQNICDSCHVR